jgi:2,3-bisphosphoglycerate-independent phosphoglycerate mutase
MEHSAKRVCLIVLDGWGHGRHDRSNAIYNANTPFTDSLYTSAPHAELRTDGEHVGLPEGQMGNSEVGHMNIGAGRVVFQDLVRISRAARSGEFMTHPVLVEAFETARKKGVRLHLMGLVSDGGVHSHLTHLEALCDMAKAMQVPAFIHAFTDGRDTDPKSGIGFIRQLESHIADTTATIASVCGRYFAMDRDKRWERVKKAYDLLTSGIGQPFKSAAEAITASYDKGVTDEFIEPSVIVGPDGSPVAVMHAGDVVICFNFRTDRCREITEVLTQQALSEHGMQPMDLHYVTMTNYDDTYKNVHVVFDKDNLELTLGEVIASAGRTQVRIAETEKYPHVTFFFSGGREKEFPGERRLLIHSPKVATYDLQPEMSAPEIAAAICADMKANHPDFICLNFANTDMVGHTGVYDAITRAAETVDKCLQEVVETGQHEGYSFIIIADHGNADYAVNEDGSPNTAHTTNPVPVWIISPGVETVRAGILADVAPTVLNLMEITPPPVMTGKNLIGSLR